MPKPTDDSELDEILLNVEDEIHEQFEKRFGNKNYEYQIRPALTKLKTKIQRLVLEGRVDELDIVLWTEALQNSFDGEFTCHEHYHSRLAQLNKQLEEEE